MIRRWVTSSMTDPRGGFGTLDISNPLSPSHLKFPLACWWNVAETNWDLKTAPFKKIQETAFPTIQILEFPAEANLPDPLVIVGSVLIESPPYPSPPPPPHPSTLSPTYIKSCIRPSSTPYSDHSDSYIYHGDNRIFKLRGYPAEQETLL